MLFCRFMFRVLIVSCLLVAQLCVIFAFIRPSVRNAPKTINRVNSGLPLSVNGFSTKASRSSLSMSTLADVKPKIKLKVAVAGGGIGGVFLGYALQVGY